MLVKFPESVALPAAFIDTRGAPAHAETTSAQTFIALNTTYAPQIASYKPRFGLYDQGDSTRLILQAVTDTGVSGLFRDLSRHSDEVRDFFDCWRRCAAAEILSGVDIFTAPAAAPPAPTAYGSSVQMNSEEAASPSSQLYPQMATECSLSGKTRVTVTTTSMQRLA